MSDTGTSTGDFDDDQRGFTSEPEETVSADTIFTEVASGAAITPSPDAEDAPELNED